MDRPCVGMDDAIYLRNYYGKILDFMEQASRTDLLPILADAIHNVDRLRGESIREIIPWLGNAISA